MFATSRYSGAPGDNALRWILDRAAGHGKQKAIEQRLEQESRQLNKRDRIESNPETPGRPQAIRNGDVDALVHRFERRGLDAQR